MAIAVLNVIKSIGDPVKQGETNQARNQQCCCNERVHTFGF